MERGLIKHTREISHTILKYILVIACVAIKENIRGILSLEGISRMRRNS